MEIILGMLLLIAGFIIFLAGGIWIIVESFRETIWWGLGVMLLPFVEIVFLVAHWRVAAKPFGAQVLGLILLFSGYHISALGAYAGI